MKRWMILILCVCLLFLAACGTASSTQQTSPVTSPPVAARTMSQDEAMALTEFGLSLLQSLPDTEENPLLSPASVAYALGMTANGAQGQTLSQMETVLGLPLLRLNEALSGWKTGLPDSDDCSLHIANGIWLRDTDGLTIQNSFLQAAARWYTSEVRKAPFNDSTVDEINGWVGKHTKGMIPVILQQMPEDVMVCLVNALAFDSKWQTPYRETQVRDWYFHPQEGVPVKVDMMLSTEWQYLEDRQAVGFVKNYAGKTCAFAALMPNEGISVTEYLESLTAEHLYTLLSAPQREEVDAGLPAFELEYSTGLTEPLAAMGITDAFSDTADFSAMGQYAGQSLYISDVLHKTYINVDPEGTKAAAATAVYAAPSSAPVEEEVKQVILERPFLYFLVDTQSHLPFFMGIFERPIG